MAGASALLFPGFAVTQGAFSGTEQGRGKAEYGSVRAEGPDGGSGVCASALRAAFETFIQ